MRPFILVSLLSFAGLFVGSYAAGDGSTVINVDVSKPSPEPIPRTLFGTFLEPIGKTLYPGLWAELLENQSFEDNLWSPAVIVALMKQRPEFKASSDQGIPLPWQPLNYQGARYEVRFHDAANSDRSLAIFALPNAESGVRQMVYPPAKRASQYQGSLYVKAAYGPAQVHVSLRRHDHPEEVFSDATIDAGENAWTRHEFSLSLPAGRIATLEPVDFAISVRNSQRVVVDQASLMPSDAIDGLDPEIVALARDMHAGVVRLGGNFTSAYHWRDGVGPHDKRPTMVNQAWGVPESNQFGTDEFLKYCELIHAEPQFAVNLGSGTPQEAADWVKYVDAKWTQHSGLLWELGNELYGNWQVGYPAESEVAARTKAVSQAILAVDPRARLIATGGTPDAFENWNAAQLDGAPGAFAYLSTHFVVGAPVKMKNPPPDFPTAASFALPIGVEHRLQLMKQQVDSKPWARGKVKFAFTEWLFVGEGERVPHYANMAGAVNTAGFLNMLMRNADTVPVSDMSGGVWFQGIWKIRGQVYVTPPYWAFRMYANADVSKLVAVQAAGETYDVHEGVNNIPEIPGVPYLDVVAAVNAKGDKLTLFCVSRKLDGFIHATLHVNGFEGAASGRMQTLRSGDIYAGNNETHPDSVKPTEQNVNVTGEILFPPASVTVIEIPKR